MRQKVLSKFALPFALFFTLWTVTLPARAFLPLIAEGAMLIAEGSTTANALAALTVGSAAGIVYLASKNSGSGSVAGSVMDIPLGTGRDRPISTPPGYTPPANNNAQPTPPGTIPASYLYNNPYVSNSWIYSNIGAACTAFAATLAQQNPASWAGSYCDHTVDVVPPSINFVVYVRSAIFPSQITSTQGSIQYSCPAGYTVSGSNCTLSNATLVMKPPDGRCQILMNVSGFVIDPNDPECGDLASKTGTTVTPTKISSATPGSTTKTQITINADGSRTITQTTANADGKTSTITTINITPAADGQTGVITGTSTSVVNGTGSATDTTPIPAGSAPIQFPTDYNREVTQGQIKTDLDSINSQLQADAFSMPADPNATVAAAKLDGVQQLTDNSTKILDGQQTDKGIWFSWVWTPSFGGSCVNPSGSIHGLSATWDICPTVNNIRDAIGWLFALFGAYEIYNMIFRRPA